VCPSATTGPVLQRGHLVPVQKETGKLGMAFLPKETKTHCSMSRAGASLGICWCPPPPSFPWTWHWAVASSFRLIQELLCAGSCPELWIIIPYNPLGSWAHFTEEETEAQAAKGFTQDHQLKQQSQDGNLAPSLSLPTCASPHSSQGKWGVCLRKADSQGAAKGDHTRQLLLLGRGSCSPQVAHGQSLGGGKGERGEQSGGWRHWTSRQITPWSWPAPAPGADYTY
jgi:hypothetical protein